MSPKKRIFRQLVSQQLLILFFVFVQASAAKLEVLNLFLSYCFFDAQQQKIGFQTQLFKTRVLTQTDIENPKINLFQTRKRTFSGLI